MGELIEEYRRAILFFEAGDPIEASRILGPVVEAEPGNAEARLVLARSYFASAQLRRAEEQLRILVERDPSDHYACHLLGRTLERQSRPAEALPYHPFGRVEPHGELGERRLRGSKPGGRGRTHVDRQPREPTSAHQRANGVDLITRRGDRTREIGRVRVDTRVRAPAHLARDTPRLETKQRLSRSGMAQERCDRVAVAQHQDRAVASHA